MGDVAGPVVGCGSVGVVLAGGMREVAERRRGGVCRWWSGKEGGRGVKGWPVDRGGRWWWRERERERNGFSFPGQMKWN